MTDPTAPTQWIHAPVDRAPEEVGYDPSRLARLEELFSDLVRSGKAQGASYCVSRHGKVFADRSMGTRRPDGSLPMLPTTWRNIASITKVLTAVGVAKLVEEGRLLMEFPVAKVLPEFDTPVLGKVTLQHLLTHTSGLAPDPGSDGEPDPDHRGFWGILDRPDWVERVARLPATTSPGQAWRYSSLGFALLGEVIARTTGEPFALWMSREVLEPAGMRDSFWDVAGRPLEGVAFVSDGNRQHFRDRPGLLGRSSLALEGLFSTSRDMVRLGNLFLAGGALDGVRVLGRKSIDALTRAHVQVPAPHWGDHFPDWNYGLGLEPARHPLITPGTVWGHEGAGRSAMWFDKESGLSMAWLLPTTLDWDPDFGWSPRAILLSGAM